jgi:hypothetical protein
MKPLQASVCEAGLAGMACALRGPSHPEHCRCIGLVCISDLGEPWAAFEDLRHRLDASSLLCSAPSSTHGHFLFADARFQGLCVIRAHARLCSRLPGWAALAVIQKQTLVGILSAASFSNLTISNVDYFNGVSPYFVQIGNVKTSDAWQLLMQRICNAHVHKPTYAGMLSV